MELLFIKTFLVLLMSFCPPETALTYNALPFSAAGMDLLALFATG